MSSDTDTEPVKSVGRPPDHRADPPSCGASWLAAITIFAALASCRPAADIRPTDLRTYTVPRSASPAAAAAPSDPRRSPALRYELPAGWIDAGATGMRLATIRTAAADAEPANVGEITVIPASGTLESNATRWQEQLTPQADPEKVSQAIAAAERVDVDGVEATILMLLDDDEANRQAILAAVIPVDDATSLFVKFKGTAELARRLRQPFTEFVRSIRWK